jgi:NAD(P)-dependent dehydrogenase (short-subunit alcohol dehydrogenase family)
MINNKVVLITGSSRGIGANLLENFAKKNFNVVINYSKSEREAVELLEKIKNINGNDTALCIKADVANRNQVNSMFKQIYDNFGRCDILINNAGVNRDSSFLEMENNDWQDVINTILTGTFNCSQEFAKRYPGDFGHIINIGAVTGISGRKNGINYCAARAGVLNMTRCLALELAPRIIVNTVTPGYIETDEVITRRQLNIKENYEKAKNSIPIGRLGVPEDIFNAVYSMVDKMTYITGQNINIDGGYLMR